MIVNLQLENVEAYKPAASPAACRGPGGETSRRPVAGVRPRRAPRQSPCWAATGCGGRASRRCWCRRGAKYSLQGTGHRRISPRRGPAPVAPPPAAILCNHEKGRRGRHQKNILCERLLTSRPCRRGSDWPALDWRLIQASTQVGILNLASWNSKSLSHLKLGFLGGGIWHFQFLYRNLGTLHHSEKRHGI